MKPASILRPVALSTLLLLSAAAGVAAQDPCPSASGADAEAGWAAYAGGDISTARGHFEAAIRRCENDHYSRTGLGYVELRDGNVPVADRLWTTVLAAEPRNVDAMVGLGIVRWRQGEVDQVRDLFTGVLELSPEHPTAVDFLERLAAAEAAARPSTDPADVAWREGRTDTALELYRARLAEDPEDLTAMLRVSLVYAWTDRRDLAIDLLDQLIEIQPGHVDARLARARVKAWSGDLMSAQSEVVEVLNVQPDNPEALGALAQFQAWAGEYDAALASYDQLLSAAPSDGIAQRQLAQTFAWASDFEASRAAYDALLERDPNDVEARLGLATVLAFSQDFAGAIEQYDAVLQNDAENVRALTGRAKTLAWAGHLVAAEEVALRAVDTDPASPDAWIILGQVYRAEGRPAAARSALDVAAQLAPTSAEVRDQLRGVNLMLAPLARPSTIYESDSDGNTMVTTSVTAGWHATNRLNIRAEGTHRALTIGNFDRSAQRVAVSSYYQMSPGWTLGVGIGGSRSDGTGDPQLFEYRASVRTPERHPLTFGLIFSSQGMHETATLAELSPRNTETLVTTRWLPSTRWRVDGSLGFGAVRGQEINGRRSASLAASRKVGRFFSLGANFRGFSYEKDLQDGYFDPDFYGLGELTSHWLYRPAPWTLLVEFAPGVQKVRTNGPTSVSVRTHVRVAYSVATAREISLGFRYSSAGLRNFVTGAADYSYTSFTLGSNWVF